MGTKDHYVNRGWLEHFADADHRVFQFNVKHQVISGPVLCSEVGFERGFWSFDIGAFLLIDRLAGGDDCARWLDSIILEVYKRSIPVQDLIPDQRKEESRYCDSWRGKYYEDL